MSVLQVERAEGYAVLTLNRPAARNALSSALREAIREAVDALSRDPAVRVLIVTGAGDAFCAGLDLAELGASGEQLQQLLAERSPVDALGSFDGPVIGAINGAAVTGGFELALACDVLIASPRARFADTHGRVGLLPIWGLSQKLSRLIGISRAKELSLTGNFLDAQRAEAWGLVNRVVPADDLLPQARALARDMLSLAPGLLTAYRQLIDDGFAVGYGDAMALEQRQAGGFNATQGAAGIAQRRQDVLARGRQQAGSSASDPRTVLSDEAADGQNGHHRSGASSYNEGDKRP
ncbi:MAG: enoyl-CoA hydratase [Pseudomonadota bacterium]